MKQIGLHLRSADNLLQMMQEVNDLNLPFFQCFLMQKTTGQYITVNKKELTAFLPVRRQWSGNIYAHGSYWINLASSHNQSAYFFLKKEIELAKKLEFTHLILHPGASTGCVDSMDGIDNIARRLNMALKRERDIIVMLENTAHGGNTVGSDINQLALIQSKLDYPECVQFCIDTAHAYAYGYNVADMHEQNRFVQLLDDAIGIKNIGLIHLNDSVEPLGSKQDKHAVIGEGKIGRDALCAFATDMRLLAIPILLELPPSAHERIQELLSIINDWFNNYSTENYEKYSDKRLG